MDHRDKAAAFCNNHTTVKSLVKYQFFIVATLLLTVQSSFADLKLASLFEDHMVLQRGKPVPVWGTADPGKDIAVKFGSQQAGGKADDKGNWRVDLPAMDANATAQVMTVMSGDQTTTVNDVLVGDVWICSGQSNMAFALSTDSTATEELPKANFPNIRLYQVKHAIKFSPQTSCTGTWQLCTPDSAKSFSAVGYFFGKEIAATQNVPVGLIGSNVGATTAQAWTPLDGLQADPVLDKAYAGDAVKLAADPAAAKAAHDAWLANGGAAYKATMAKWRADDWAAKTKGLPEPPKIPPYPTPEPSYESTDTDPGATPTSTSLYNGMIAPLEPFAIKGVIWYQGESGGQPYDKIFNALITGWRKHWGAGDFPFLFVQLPNYTKRIEDPNGPAGWADTREKQMSVLKLPNTGEAVTIEVGDGNNLHPPYKEIVGHRLALAARQLAYGEKVLGTSPTLDAVKFDGATAIVTFKDTGDGLKIETPPVAPPGWTPPPTDHVVGFALAGDDKKFVWAKGTISGPSTVTVTADGVTAPKYVRYAWGADPEVNLYNSADLPVSPFRTDPPPPVPAPK
jgi:sialate O-acetylesterase